MKEQSLNIQRPILDQEITKINNISNCLFISSILSFDIFNFYDPKINILIPITVATTLFVISEIYRHVKTKKYFAKKEALEQKFDFIIKEEAEMELSLNQLFKK